MLEPSPGIILALPLETPAKGLKLELKTNENIISAKVLKIGADEQTPFGVLKGSDYAKVGDIIYFLSYEQRNYDWVRIDRQKYYIIKFQDVRGVLNA